MLQLLTELPANLWSAQTFRVILILAAAAYWIEFILKLVKLIILEYREMHPEDPTLHNLMYTPFTLWCGAIMAFAVLMMFIAPAN